MAVHQKQKSQYLSSQSTARYFEARRFLNRILLSLMLLTAPISQTLGETDAETEIRLLIQAVRESGCEFDRNVALYTA